MWKFTARCLMHQRLLTSFHWNAASVPFCIMLNVDSNPTLRSEMIDTFGLSWTTVYFTLDRNHSQLSMFSLLIITKATGSN